MYNKTQLNPEVSFERHVFHRDQFAHYLRWTHVLKRARIGMNVLDFGCGSANLLEVFYRNRFKCKEYLGLDVRKKTIENNQEKFSKVDWAKFQCVDLCGSFSVNDHWDLIACFEVIEHIGKDNALKFLSNIKNCMNKDTVLLLSTPNFDEKVGPAANHVIDGENGEFEYNELKALLGQFFVIEETYGTFASQKDYKEYIDNVDWLKITFDRLNAYYDCNLVSNIMAPIVPARFARNVLWICKLKGD